MDDKILYEIYELYIKRVQKEFGFTWVRFKGYLWFNTALIIAIAFFSQQYVDKNDILKTNEWLMFLLFIFSIIGLLFSILFYNINKDGKRWLFLINEEIKKIEDKLFIKHIKGNKIEGEIGLYKNILKEYETPTILEKYDKKIKWKYYFKDTKSIDYIDINIATAKIFSLIWIASSSSFFILFWKCIQTLT